MRVEPILTPEGVMHHLGGYPGVTLGGDQDIVGEVYAVGPVLEAQLDAIESEYLRPRPLR